VHSSLARAKDLERHAQAQAVYRDRLLGSSHRLTRSSPSSMTDISPIPAPEAFIATPSPTVPCPSTLGCSP
jgi:hypothetical protein